MARRMMVAIACAGVALTSIAAAAMPAAAGGGSRLVADRERYRPGDAVHLTATVTKLDLDWFGPYTTYLRPLPADGGSVADAGSGDQDIAIGRLVVTRLDPTTVRAEVTFVLPKVPDGEWLVLSCSPGCTHPLGDLMGGWLRVGEPPPAPPTTAPNRPPTPAPTTTVVPVTSAGPVPVTTAPAAVSRASATTSAPAAVVAVGTAGSEPGELRWWALGALVVAALAAAPATLARRGRGRRSVTASTTIPIDDGAPVIVPLEPAGPDDEPIGAERASGTRMR